MRVVLLAAAGLIAAAAATTPAAAGGSAAAGFTGFTGVTVHHNRGFTSLQSLRGNRHDRRRNRGHDGFADGGFYYDREYEGDTLWQAESYNDWWHERPWRAYPAWVTRNQNCERQYWSGGGWTC
ncbi:MAG TPA: hypothetical protein VK485_07745 [Sphingomicrobium sp.]|nr:hypothetical protein [Sphingomicrobium sp.]